MITQHYAVVHPAALKPHCTTNKTCTMTACHCQSSLFCSRTTLRLQPSIPFRKQGSVTSACRYDVGSFSMQPSPHQLALLLINAAAMMPINNHWHHNQLTRHTLATFLTSPPPTNWNQLHHYSSSVPDCSIDINTSHQTSQHCLSTEWWLVNLWQFNATSKL